MEREQTPPQFIVECDVNLERLLDILQKEKDLASILPPEVKQERLSSVEWILSEMQQAGVLERKAAALKRTLEPNIRKFLNEISRSERAPYHDNQNLNILLIDHLYWMQSSELDRLYYVEVARNVDFFESRASILYGKFQHILQELGELAHKERSLYREGYQESDPELEQLYAKAEKTWMKVQGFYLAVNLVMDNVDAGTRAVHSALRERASEGSSFATYTRRLYRELTHHSARSPIAQAFPHREHCFDEKWQALNRQNYEKIWQRAQKKYSRFQKMPRLCLQEPQLRSAKFSAESLR